MIKYIGSKRTLVPQILALAEAIRARTGATTACDLFTGTTRVAQGLKSAGFAVTANDLATYAELFAIAYVEADAGRIDAGELERKLRHLDALPDVDGYATQMFCREARYFKPENGQRIDAIRPAIERIAGDRIERAILLTALIEAADRVDSTTGLQMAYLKQWAPRASNRLTLRLPDLLAGPGRALREDANVLAGRLEPVDIAYIDPPYNQHSYHANYHVWETLARGDAPESYGVARKRIDCRTIKSAYNARRLAWQAFSGLVRTIQATHLIVSFNDEGYFTYDEIVSLLEDARGEAAAVPVSFKRYVGAQIGIHNPRGERVGKVSHLRNREYVFVAGPEAAAIVARGAIPGTRAAS